MIFCLDVWIKRLVFLKQQFPTDLPSSNFPTAHPDLFTSVAQLRVTIDLSIVLQWKIYNFLKAKNLHDNFLCYLVPEIFTWFGEEFFRQQCVKQATFWTAMQIFLSTACCSLLAKHKHVMTLPKNSEDFCSIKQYYCCLCLSPAQPCKLPYLRTQLDESNWFSILPATPR